MQVMFETMQVPALRVVLSGKLALIASGRTTGIILESGHGFSCAVPIDDRQALHQAVTSLGLGGRDITKQLFLPAINNCGSDNFTGANLAFKLFYQLLHLEYCSLFIQYRRLLYEVLLIKCATFYRGGLCQTGVGKAIIIGNL
jgi:hypothetical protein